MRRARAFTLPTVDVVRLVRSNFTDEYIRRQVERIGNYNHLEPLDQAVAMEIACRELLDAQRWLLPRL